MTSTIYCIYVNLIDILRYKNEHIEIQHSCVNVYRCFDFAFALVIGILLPGRYPEFAYISFASDNKRPQPRTARPRVQTGSSRAKTVWTRLRGSRKKRSICSFFLFKSTACVWDREKMTDE